ncbi:MAG: hypothetical protein ACO1OB_12630 [Archangium sp.]
MKPEYERRRKQMAEFMAKANAESIARAAAAGPAANVEQAIRLSDNLLKLTANPEKPSPPSLVALYRQRKAER